MTEQEARAEAKKEAQRRWPDNPDHDATRIRLGRLAFVEGRLSSPVVEAAPSDTDRDTPFLDHEYKPGKFSGGCQVMLTRYRCPYPPEAHPTSQPVQVEVTDRPEVVVLCGSTRFYDEFQEANYRLTMEGKIVLSVGFYPHAKAKHGHGEGVGHDSAEKIALDELHKRKIDLADRVLVLNVGGYIGESTRSEVEYAERIGRPVDWLEPRAALGGGDQ